MSLPLQIRAFIVVGLIAAVAHYGFLIGLVETFGWAPVPATLAGFLAGGTVSYVLNRRHTFASERPHGEAGWRFGAVTAVGFGLTFVSMSILVNGLSAPYMPAQILTTGMVMVWNFLANKFWTFGGEQRP